MIIILLIECTRKPTTVEWRYTEQGERVRISKRTGLEIPIPKNAEETIDYKARSGYPGMLVLIDFLIYI